MLQLRHIHNRQLSFKWLVLSNTVCTMPLYASVTTINFCSALSDVIWELGLLRKFIQTAASQYIRFTSPSGAPTEVIFKFSGICDLVTWWAAFLHDVLPELKSTASCYCYSSCTMLGLPGSWLMSAWRWVQGEGNPNLISSLHGFISGFPIDSQFEKQSTCSLGF